MRFHAAISSTVPQRSRDAHANFALVKSMIGFSPEFYRMLEGVEIDDAGLFNDRLQEWENFYSFS